MNNEERELVQTGKNLSKKEIWAMLERKRFQELQTAAINLQGELMVYNRCPKCTLVPPCAHYESPDNIANIAPKLMQSPPFKSVLSPTKRNNLLKMVKSHQSSNENAFFPQGENSYYIDTLQNLDTNEIDHSGNTISINRVSNRQNASLPKGFGEQSQRNIH